MHKLNHRTEMAARMEAPRTSVSSRQNGRLLVALSLLLIALTVVIFQDREFWFGSEEAVESGPSTDVVVKTNSAAVVKPVQPVAAQAAAKSHTSAKPVAHSAVPQPSSQTSASQISANPPAPIVATDRVALPPLDVEVVAGDSHRTIRPGSNVAKVEIPVDSNRHPATSAAAAAATNAAQHERLSVVNAPELQQTITPAYPTLGQHSQVQGSVILQAVIGADGLIENLRVVSGPAILASAAQQAVRQWHFKPYLQNGQPVETKTRITVNFNIRVADNSATS